MTIEIKFIPAVLPPDPWKRLWAIERALDTVARTLRKAETELSESAP